MVTQKQVVRRKLRTTFLWAFLTLGMLLLAGVLYLRGAFLPRHLSWERGEESIPVFTAAEAAGKDPLSGSDKDSEIQSGASQNLTLRIRNRHFSLLDSEKECYAAPKDVLAQNVLAADIDHDGVNEVLLLCWRRANYGSSQPFWTKGNDRSFSQHLFIYKFITTREDGQPDPIEPGDPADNLTLRPIFMSSDLGTAYISMSADEEARIHLTDPDGSDTVWVWNYWGMQLLG